MWSRRIQISRECTRAGNENICWADVWVVGEVLYDEPVYRGEEIEKIESVFENCVFADCDRVYILHFLEDFWDLIYLIKKLVFTSGWSTVWFFLLDPLTNRYQFCIVRTLQQVKQKKFN